MSYEWKTWPMTTMNEKTRLICFNPGELSAGCTGCTYAICYQEESQQHRDSSLMSCGPVLMWLKLGPSFPRIWRTHLKKLWSKTDWRSNSGGYLFKVLPFFVMSLFSLSFHCFPMNGQGEMSCSHTMNYCNYLIERVPSQTFYDNTAVHEDVSIGLPVDL